MDRRGNTEEKEWRKWRRRARISLIHGSSFLSDFKSNGTPTGVPDFFYIPKEKNRSRPKFTQQEEATRGKNGSDQKNVTLERTPYNHNSTIAVETDNTNLSVMSYTAAHIIPSLNKIVFLFFFV